jgi:hypothetical protein
MLENAKLRRDEEGVSAAVATVLLFGGVLSLIGMMLFTMLPVIQELEGSVERNGMATQMNNYAIQTVRLAETGMPGDSVSIDLDPLEGELAWDYMRGGSWISATWSEGQSLRLRNALNLDSEVEFRYPHGEVGSICWDDLRLGPERLHQTRIPDISGTVLVVPKIGIAEDLKPLELELRQGSSSVSGKILGASLWSADLPLDGMNGEAWLSSNAAVDVYLWRGKGGSTEVPPAIADSETGRGNTWTIPLGIGTTTLYLTSLDTMRIDWRGVDNSGSEIAVAGGGFYAEGAVWTKSFTVEEVTLLSLSSSADARLLMIGGVAGSGDAPWPATTGALIGTEFLPPAGEGVVLLDNPTSKAVVVRYLGGALSVAANDILRIDWPPDAALGAPVLRTDSEIQIHWMPRNDDTGLDRNGSLAIHSAADTGRISGQYFNFSTPTLAASVSDTKVTLQVAGVESQWNLTTWNVSGSNTHAENSVVIAPNNTEVFRLEVIDGDSMRPIVTVGDDGLAYIPHDGAQRCSFVGTQASGWISTRLPWITVAGLSAGDIEKSWRNGLHPSSMVFTIYGSDGEHPHSTVATAWAFHMPSLFYSFKSSITGMETSTRGGAVLTNHPEMQASAIRGPSDRSGPGPRFATTVPLAFPIGDSVSGSADVNVDLRLIQRHQLASSVADEVRRGWDGPYGIAIAGLATQDLSYSTDWTTFPQQLQLLNDYNGWVPDPTTDSSETVYHTQGEQIQFTLQVSVLHHLAQEDL